MDELGRYNRAEMREMVRRRLDLLRATVDIVTGAESAIEQLDPLVSNEDIDMCLNAALTKRFIDMSLADVTLYSDESSISVEVNTTEYRLPSDMAFLRGLYWKSPSDTRTLIPPNERSYMYEDDIDMPIMANLGTSEVPTYRRRLNFLVLNQVPQESNTDGILVCYVKWIEALRDDGQMIENQFAPLLQEAIILDSAIELAEQKEKMDATTLRQSADELTARLIAAVTMRKTPKVIRMIPHTTLTVDSLRRFQ